MFNKKVNKTALTMAFILFLSGCGGKKAEEKPVAKKEPQKITVAEDEFVFRDKKALYANENPLEVVPMYLTVSSGNSSDSTDHTWEEINTYSVFDYERMGVSRYKVDGLLQIGNKDGIIGSELGQGQMSPNSIVQIRGQTSSKYPQKNYKIKLLDNKGQWRGQSTIALNKHQQDGLRFRNKLAYDLINGIDEMMGLRTTFVHLFVKDTTASGDGQFHDYGIYTQVEQLNKTALRAHGLDRNGHLYKINVFEFYRYEDTIKLTDDPSFDLEAFEYRLETKGSDDHHKLIKMLDRLNDFSIPIENILEESFDTENLCYWLAYHILTGNIDTQSRNCYLYSSLNSDKWYFITWDNDGALSREENEIRDRLDYQSWESGVSNYWGNILFQRCLKSEDFRKELDETIKKLKKYLSPERIGEMANSYAEVVKPFIYRFPDREFAPLTSDQYDRVLRSIPDEIEINYNLYKESLEKPMPFYIGTPIKEEGRISIEWDGSYDFDGEAITYTFELARDHSFSNPIIKQEGLRIPTIHFDILPQGKYFMRVTAANESGFTQHAFDYYATEKGKVYGTKCFYVKEDGKIVEDVYVEG